MSEVTNNTQQEKKERSKPTTLLKTILTPINISIAALLISICSVILSKCSLQETKNQFKVQNEPFLQIESTRPDFIANSPVEIMITIKNLGKYPCKVFKIFTTYAARKAVPKFEDVSTMGTEAKIDFNTYITDANPIQRNIATRRSYDLNTTNGIINGILAFYTWGYVEYQNMATEEFKTYKFMIQYKYIPSLNAINYEFIINENVDGKYTE